MGSILTGSRKRVEVRTAGLRGIGLLPDDDPDAQFFSLIADFPDKFPVRQEDELLIVHSAHPAALFPVRVETYDNGAYVIDFTVRYDRMRSLVHQIPDLYL